MSFPRGSSFFKYHQLLLRRALNCIYGVPLRKHTVDTTKEIRSVSVRRCIEGLLLSFILIFLRSSFREVPAKDQIAFRITTQGAHLGLTCMLRPHEPSRG